MKKTIKYFALYSVFIFLISCNGNKGKSYSDTPTSGKITIGIDETLKPIGDAEVMVFNDLYQNADIKPNYLTEQECFNGLMKDSFKMIISSRMLTENEKSFFKSKALVPKEIKIGTDAIALIVNPKNIDTLMTLDMFFDILKGKISKWNQVSAKNNLGNISVVFDNQNSSTARFISEKLGSEKLSKSVYALDLNTDVVDFVSKNPSSIGVIGVSWISDKDDSLCLSFLNDIKVVALSTAKVATPNNSYKPFQLYMLQKDYPLTRDFWAINVEPRVGLASGFTQFVSSDKGQRIILKAGILPAYGPVRLVNIREEL